jgi:beta-lactamase regulating signal transducer with metallopeptidase domain
MPDLVSVGLANAAVAAVLALLAVAAGRLARRPAVAHVLWLLVLVKLVTPPLWTVSLPWAVASTAPPEGAVVLVTAEAAEPAGRDWGATLVAALLVVWAAGSLVWFARAAVKIARFHRLLHLAAAPPPELKDLADRLARRMGLKQCPPIAVVPGSVPPLVWAAVGRPRVYLPAELLARLSPEEQASLVAHELAHVCRGDHWVRWLELVVLGLYWWYPVAWLARRQLQAHEEECCDAWVIDEVPPRAYATAILTTLDFLAEGRPVPAMASGLGRTGVLKRRLARIMTGGRPKRLNRTARVAVVAFAAALLPLLPTFAAPEPVESPAPPASEASELTLTITSTPDGTQRRARMVGVATVVESQFDAGVPRRDLYVSVLPVGTPGEWVAVAPAGFDAQAMPARPVRVMVLQGEAPRTYRAVPGQAAVYVATLAKSPADGSPIRLRPLDGRAQFVLAKDATGRPVQLPPEILQKLMQQRSSQPQP